MPGPPLRVLFWGTYDLSKPRNRILLRGLREAGAEVSELHASVWETVRDKSVVGVRALVMHLLRAARSYPRLLFAFAAARKPDVVVIGYMGELDVMLLAPLARLYGVPLVWDQFISLYDTVVDDRSLVSPSHPLAKLIFAWEWLACRAADRVLMDTEAHAAYVKDTFRLPDEMVASVLVGVESEHFRPTQVVERGSGKLEVLFYGQFIALHGIETIVEAARLLESEPIAFHLIGTGQEEPRIRAMLAEHPLENLTWEPWVEYEKLVERIERADVCLGIFGTSGKADRVIPNKVFQIISARKPLVTRDSRGIREIFRGDEPGLFLVEAGNPRALAERLKSLAHDRSALPKTPHRTAAEAITPRAIGEQALNVLLRVVERSRRP